jgi:DNA-binding CsgD family transcriptional regulator
VSAADEIIGREAELEELAAFSKGSTPALVLSGGAGIGKTTLWKAGTEAARRRGARVLTTSASEAETRLSFAGLVDLLDGVDVAALASLPIPQRRALEVALLRAEPGHGVPDASAIALSCLNALRALASDTRVLVAIDDVQWLDTSSAAALTFAARRIDGEPVSFLLAKRTGASTAFERALEPRLKRLELGPLSLGAVRRLLLERLGLTLPRQLLRRLVDATIGNPLFALEVGHALAARGMPRIGDDLPVPEAVEDLLGTRIGRLPASTRKLLLSLALDADLDVSQLAKIVGVKTVEDAVHSGLALVDGDRVRASHPLLAAAARTRARPSARRELHRKLAGVVADEELRTRHLALATDDPDPELASTVARMAARAGARGARDAAVELGEHALRLTPVDSAAHAERLLGLADHLVLAGEKQRATDLLVPALDLLPAGEARARAVLILASGVVRSDNDIARYFDRALAESRSSPDLHATLVLRMAQNRAFLDVTRIAEAEGWAVEALVAARRAGQEVERVGLDALAWIRVVRGLPIDDLCNRFRSLAHDASYIAASPERAAGQRLAWRGEIAAARAVLARLQALADERAESGSYFVLRLHRCELELRAGELEVASRLLDEWGESREPELPAPTQYNRCRALLAAARGRQKEAERWSTETIDRAEATGSRWDLLEALRALGVSALRAHEPARAAEALRTVWEHTEREGVDEPGVFPVAPELVEALVDVGELDKARAVADRLRMLAEDQQHPWGLPTATRCDALVRLCAEPRDEEAPPMLEQAAGEYGRLGLRYDRARTLRLLGRAQRRRKKWAAARRVLEEAAAAFDELGADGWAEAARSELARVSARRPRSRGELTAAERRVVELAAEGRSNKEIAQALFVAVNTVETHLSHAYAKLGVRSRAQLAARLSSDA